MFTAELLAIVPLAGEAFSQVPFVGLVTATDVVKLMPLVLPAKLEDWEGGWFPPMV
jgi:hypothetical protein